MGVDKRSILLKASNEKERWMKSYLYVPGGLLLTFVSLAGCSSYRSHLESTYGNSFRQVTSGQILHAEVKKFQESVTGLDGHAAEYVMEKYYEGFKKTEAPPLYTIGNIGTLGIRAE